MNAIVRSWDPTFISSRQFALTFDSLAWSNLTSNNAADFNINATVRFDTSDKGSTFLSFRNFFTQFSNFSFTSSSHLSLRFAQTYCRDFARSNATAYQVVSNYVSTTLRQSLVVFFRTHEVSVTFNTYSLYAFVAQALSQSVQFFLSFRTQVIFVEAEQSFSRQGNSLVNILRSLLYGSNCFTITTFDTTLGLFVKIAGFPAFAIVVADNFLRLAAYDVAVFGVRFAGHSGAGGNQGNEQCA
ncbi:Uncharacterised protein [Mycobacteroides abscessus subsp. massiliense]|nr:Uncharacterised protein [Mycobacteroides abscessus subsp. massiliense]